jgi:hypothetical protein
MEKTNEPAERLIVLAVASTETKGGTMYPVQDGLLGTRKDMPAISE